MEAEPQTWCGSTDFYTKPLARKTYPAGRICAKRGCATVLSVYNSGKYCCIHEAAERQESLPNRVTGKRTCRVCNRKLPVAAFALKLCGDRMERCEECRADSVKRRAGQFVPIEPTREHVMRLRAAGMSLKRIAWAAGYTQATMVYEVLRPDRERVQATTAARLLAVEVDQ